MQHRPRRLRFNKAIRSMVASNHVTVDDLIYPIFIKEDSGGDQEIKSMPGIKRLTIDSALKEIESLHSKGLNAIAIFPVIDESLKSEDAREAFNPAGLTQRTIQAFQKELPELLTITDVALDPYTSHGHDGLIKNGHIDNDTTVEALCKMALVQADAGADIVAPSDMMDGRIGAIRNALDHKHYINTLIMSYTAKYASCLYGPFREALGSLGSKALTENVPKDKLSYQMNPNSDIKEAMRELALDYEEGADIVMVKPASWYLDIIKSFSEESLLPVAAYQVSGEYSMIHSASQNGFIDLNKAMNESLTAIKRAGAQMILTYFAKDFINNY